jgi:hypothetical protein
LKNPLLSINTVANVSNQLRLNLQLLENTLHHSTLLFLCGKCLFHFKLTHWTTAHRRRAQQGGYNCHSDFCFPQHIRSPSVLTLPTSSPILMSEITSIYCTVLSFHWIGSDFLFPYSPWFGQTWGRNALKNLIRCTCSGGLCLYNVYPHRLCSFSSVH